MAETSFDAVAGALNSKITTMGSKYYLGEFAHNNSGYGSLALAAASAYGNGYRSMYALIAGHDHCAVAIYNTNDTHFKTIIYEYNTIIVIAHTPTTISTIGKVDLTVT